MTGSANYDVSAAGVLVHVRGEVQPPVARQLVAVDRKGVAEPLVAERRDYWRPRVSPDGTRVAVEVTDDRGEHVWTVDLDDGNAAPLEVDSLRSVFSTWTPDGRFVIFRVDRAENYGIYQQPADGSEAPRLLHEATEDVMPGDVSRDGVLVFASGEQTGRRSIWTLPLKASRAAPFLETPALEHMPVFSADGKWIAYASNETGRSEIYVRAYPAGGAPARLISENGGTAPLWSPDGSELFYRNPAGSLVAVPMRAGSRSGRIQELFHVQGRFRTSGNAAAYDIERSGRRFIMVTEPDNPRPVREQITLVVNWFEELKRLAPISR
jgi:serine/threonine-protein kinase